MSQDRWHAARALAKSGDTSGALEQLREAIRRGELDPQQLERAGALARKLVAGQAHDVTRVAVLGECTTHWLTNSLAAIAVGDGPRLVLHDGGYDSVLQELHSDALRDFEPKIVVLLPWHRDSSAPGTLAEQLDHWRGVYQTIGSRFAAGIVQVGYDWVDPGPDGYHLASAPGGAISAIRRANEALRASLPQGCYFVDLPSVSGDLGRRTFYDPRRYHWTKQPFSEAGIDWLARHVWAGIRAQIQGPKKVLVLDLDNTVWGGVVGEVGPTGVELGESAAGEAYRALQRHAKALTRRGILLTVASKNDEADARAPFLQNPEMLLSLDDFASFEAHWSPKSESIARSAERLRLGVDSFVFLDDNPTEREEVRQRANSVSVVDAPLDAAEYTRTLVRELWFEGVGVTQEDAQRTDQYQAEATREKHRAEHASLGDYLTSLELSADVRDIDEADMKRVVQLVGKTNQFNLTTPRYSRAELEAILSVERAFGLSLRLRDRFGDYGLILVVVGRPVPENTLEIDTFLMSCRAISRTVEEFAWGKVLERARSLGYERILGVYRQTPKNQLVSELYPRLGLTLVSAETGERRYTQAVQLAIAPVTFVQPSEVVLPSADAGPTLA